MSKRSFEESCSSATRESSQAEAPMESSRGLGLASLAAAADMVNSIMRGESAQARSSQTCSSTDRGASNRSADADDGIEKSQRYVPRYPSHSNRSDELPRIWSLRRMRYEHFYSTMDEEYFKINEFAGVMAHIGVDVSRPIRREALSEIRRTMSERVGTARRFSAAFVAKERQRLSHNRKLIRFNSHQPLLPGEEPASHKTHHTIHRGDFVVAYSKINKVLCRGRVIADGPFHADNWGYLISFDNKAFRNEWCNDFDVKITERYYGPDPLTSVGASSTGMGAEQCARTRINIANSIGNYVEHARAAVRSVLEQKSGSVQYPPVLLDIIVRCVALILWMKKSVNVANASRQEIDQLTEESLDYVTGDLGDIAEEEKTAIFQELQGTIRNMFAYANEKSSAI